LTAAGERDRHGRTYIVQQERVGPVDYVVIEFTEPSAARAGFDRLLDLVDRSEIRILDLEFVHSIDGLASTVAAHSVDESLAQFDGAASGLLDRHDLDRVAANLSHGATAAVLVYEELPMVNVLDAWESGGAHVVSEGPVDLADIEEALGGGQR
jgi:hypothetical protein